MDRQHAIEGWNVLLLTSSTVTAIYLGWTGQWKNENELFK